MFAVGQIETVSVKRGFEASRQWGWFYVSDKLNGPLSLQYKLHIGRHIIVDARPTVYPHQVKFSFFSRTILPAINVFMAARTRYM